MKQLLVLLSLGLVFASHAFSYEEDGFSHDILHDGSDNAFSPNPGWNEPAQSPIPDGAVITSYSPRWLPNAVGKDKWWDAYIGLWKDLAGQNYTVGLGYYTSQANDSGTDIVTAKKYLLSLGVPSLFYNDMMGGNYYHPYLARENAFDQTESYQSCKTTSQTSPSLLSNHTFDCADDQPMFSFSHPAATHVMHDKIDGLSVAGISTFLAVDWTFPHYLDLWGYSDSMLRVYMDDLKGLDSGVNMSDGTLWNFEKYFIAYNGYYPKPTDLGTTVTSWNNYTPPRGTDFQDPNSSHMKLATTLWYYLTSWETLKFADRTGKYYQTKPGGQRIWLMPNPENPYGAKDLTFMARTKNVGNLMPEWFSTSSDSTSGSAEALYASMPMLRAEVDRNNSRLSLAQEDGLFGSGYPYLDYRNSFNAVYSLTAMGKLQNFEQDWSSMRELVVSKDPDFDYCHFNQFRDFASKIKAFKQAYKEKPTRSPAQILSVSYHSPASLDPSFYNDLNQSYSLAPALSRTHLLFDQRDSVDLDMVLPNYQILAYASINPKVGDFTTIVNWLGGAPGRKLVTHTFIPTRTIKEGWLSTSNATGTSGGDSTLGINPIIDITSTASKTPSIGYINPLSQWQQNFASIKTPLRFDSPTNPVTRTKIGPNGKVTIMVEDTDKNPLVSMVTVPSHNADGSANGRYNVIYYLNFSARDPQNSPDVELLNEAVMKVIAIENGITPAAYTDSNTAVQVFNVADGKTILAWDRPTIQHQVAGDPGNYVQPYSAPGMSHAISIPSNGWAAAYVYDFWNDTLASYPANNGVISWQMNNVTNALYYVSPYVSSTVRQNAQVLRAELRNKWKFDTATGLQNQKCNPYTRESIFLVDRDGHAGHVRTDAAAGDSSHLHGLGGTNLVAISESIDPQLDQNVYALDSSNQFWKRLWTNGPSENADAQWTKIGDTAYAISAFSYGGNSPPPGSTATPYIYAVLAMNGAIYREPANTPSDRSYWMQVGKYKAGIKSITEPNDGYVWAVVSGSPGSGDSIWRVNKEAPPIFSDTDANYNWAHWQQVGTPLPVTTAGTPRQIINISLGNANNVRYVFALASDNTVWKFPADSNAANPAVWTVVGNSVSYSGVKKISVGTDNFIYGIGTDSYLYRQPTNAAANVWSWTKVGGNTSLMDIGTR